MIINFLIVIQENSMIIKAMKKSLQFVNDLILDKKGSEISFRAEMIRFKLLVLSLQLELMRKSWAN